MAYMIQTGPDTFKYVSDEEESRQAQYVERDNKPPLPPEARLSFSSPTEMAKMEAANAVNMDRPAREMLYETPIAYKPYPEGSGVLGFYERGPGMVHAYYPEVAGSTRPPITSYYGYPSQDNTLAHEAAHHWYYTQMPVETRREFERSVSQMPDYDHFRREYGEENLQQREKNWAANPIRRYLNAPPVPAEVYAQAMETGGNAISADWRDKYYAGLLAPKPNLPPPPPLNAGANLRPPTPRPDHEVGLIGADTGPKTLYQTAQERYYDQIAQEQMPFGQVIPDPPKSIPFLPPPAPTYSSSLPAGFLQDWQEGPISYPHGEMIGPPRPAGQFPSSLLKEPNRFGVYG
jgi:hypothetical protein